MASSNEGTIVEFSGTESHGAKIWRVGSGTRQGDHTALSLITFRHLGEVSGRKSLQYRGPQCENLGHMWVSAGVRKEL